MKHKTNRHLYDSMRHYGVENFTIEIIEETTRDSLNEREIWWINHLNTTDRSIGYNMSFGGLGGIRTPEVIERIAAKRRGIPLSDEHKTAISRGNKGIIKPVSEESKAKISATLKAKYASGELTGSPPIPKTGVENHRFGKHHSDSAKALLSEARKGKTFVELFGEEGARNHKQRMAAKFVGDKNPNYVYVPQEDLKSFALQMSLDELAAKYGCNKVTIHNKLKSYYGKTWTQLREENK